MTTEVLPILPEQIRPGSSITSKRDVEVGYRPVSASLPIVLEGVCLPKPDLSHAPSIAAGFQKRVVNPVPQEFSTTALLELGAFVDGWLRQNLDPLEADSDVSVEAWLHEANYPAWRKAELLALDPEEVANWQDHITAKSFIKDEFYPEIKYPRTINPRDDYFKVFSGPIFHAIEKRVFALPVFIKKVPIDQRGRYIMDTVYATGARYVLTDYTSFESSFTKEAMENLEMKLYSWMSHKLPGGVDWFEAIRTALTGMQKLESKMVTTTTLAGRLSGDMCTSLGNGFSNYMLMLFAAQQLNLGTLFGVFEGDDGLCRFSTGLHPPAEYFRRFGFNVKMEVVDEIGQASFCGMVFEEHSCQQMCEPLGVLASFGWTSARYLKASDKTLLALTRAKALSLAFERPGCPILSAFAHRVIYLTRGIDCRWVAQSRNTTHWMRERLHYVTTNKAPFEEPTTATRLLFEELYDISIEEQLKLERDFERLEISHFCVDLQFPTLWRDIWDRYVLPLPPNPRDPWHVASQTESQQPAPIRMRGRRIQKGAENPYLNV